MTKDTSCNGHRDRTALVFREKAIYHDDSDLGEFPARVGQHLQGKDVLTCGNDGKERSKVRRRTRIRGAGEIVQRSNTPGFAESCHEFPVQNALCSSISRIRGAQDGAHCGPPDPMSGAFIADSESPASGAGCRSLLVTAVGDRTGAGNDDDSRSAIEGGFERDVHVADHVDGSGDNFGKGLAHDFSQLRTSGPGPSNASMRDLRRRDPGGGTCLAHRLLK